jgi:hypothetical protein
MLGMTANTFAIAVGNYISSSNVRQLLFFSIELGALLRTIQFERDMSALYVSNILSTFPQLHFLCL